MDPTVGRTQQTALVVLRTLIGWHFLYEGFAKVVTPAWSRAGAPLGHFTSAGYLRGSSGPFADLFRGLADASWLPWLDVIVAWSLVLIGLGLMLGLFTQLACVGALALLSLFYLSWLPTSGVREAGAEGAYLLVNKNLIEAAAVAVVLAFRTDRIAGLDLLRTGDRAPAAPVAEATR
jgi:thiosulfate dehydrogenase [quinone] large subunit